MPYGLSAITVGAGATSHDEAQLTLFTDNEEGWAELADGFRTEAFGAVGIQGGSSHTACVDAFDQWRAPTLSDEVTLHFSWAAIARWLQVSGHDPTGDITRLFLDGADVIEATTGFIYWLPTRDPRLDWGFGLSGGSSRWREAIPDARWGLLLGPDHVAGLARAGRDPKRCPCAVVDPRPSGGIYLQLTASLREWDDDRLIALREFLAPIIRTGP